MSAGQKGPGGVAPGGLTEFLAVIAVAVVLTAALAYPLVFRLGSIGRLDLDDGRFSIWNVAWVARTLVVDPRHVFDTNIFYPHRQTLAYSENNIGAGILAIPAYWLSRNPYLAHNFALVAAFALTAAGMYYLVCYLTGDRRAAAISAICFAFCPYVFVHTAHIQLEMTAGLPFGMLAFHRLVDRPSLGRGAVLGGAMAAQALSCGYYGIFIALMIGFAVLVVSVTRGYWRNRTFWIALAAGAVVSFAIMGPIFAPYQALRQAGQLTLPLTDALQFSADWRAYLASGAYAHGWILGLLGHWREALFPGFVAVIGGLAGLSIAVRNRRWEFVTLYGGLVGLAAWTSFGPAAGFYTFFYRVLPVFSLIHAPARFGLIVIFGFAVFTGVGVAALLDRLRHPLAAVLLIGVVAAGELAVGIDFQTAQPVSPAYLQLATLPPGPLIEMPFYERRAFYPKHTIYMLASTSHWMPLVNGYSDYIPDDFRQNAVALAPFPFPGAFKLLQRDGVRYALFHMNFYDAPTRAEVEGRLREFASFLRPLYTGVDERLFEIVGSP